jgi:hypothetical protein
MGRSLGRGYAIRREMTGDAGGAQHRAREMPGLLKATDELKSPCAAAICFCGPLAGQPHQATFPYSEYAP